MSRGVDGLPASWTSLTLGALVESITYGYTESATSQPVGPRFLRITDLQDGAVNWDTVPFCRCTEVDKYKLKSGDIVIARTGATTGKSYLLADPPDAAVFASYLIRLETNDQLPAEFLAQYLQSPAYWRQIITVKKGSAQPGANASVLSDLQIPVAPLNEQRRIVAKVEALQARASAVKEALDAIPPLLEKFRQSVLAAAFRGDLTREWREAHPDVEPAAKLLERIRAERKRRWVEANPKKAYVEPEPVDTEGLPELPGGWCWVESETACGSVRDGTHDTPKYVAHGVPLVTSKNLKNGKVDLNSASLISLEDHLEISKRSAVAAGDVLFAMIGTVGNPTVVYGEAAFSIKNIALFKSNPGMLVSEYLALWLEAPAFKKWLEHNVQGSTQKFASLGLLRRLPVPVAPPAEQLALVEAVAHRNLLQASASEAVRQVGGPQLQALSQSILSKAFRGELIPQDPNDEPASALLDRIRRERESNSEQVTAKRSRGRPKATET